ncbi:MAG: NAD(P)/FAD-dependent oxidoreductase [Clostridia bacterium]|nr:NAD(P)/FAD-dependent oxidoreductase [Clostridia bacterium]
MSKSFEKKVKKIHEVDPSIEVTEERGCIVLRGELDDWNKIVRAGKKAAGKEYYGVINDIKLKGFEPKVKLPSVKDKLYDGSTPDVLIIGGGLTGCATARELSKYNLDIMLIEKGPDVSSGQSSRNGGAVHVGINYSPKSGKHIYCHRGNAMFEQLSDELDFPFERPGHLLICKEKWEKILLYVLWLNSFRLHIDGVKVINREELLKLEPYAPSWTNYALYMPTGGFMSPYKFNIALAENAVQNGAKIYLDTACVGMEVKDGKIISVETNRGTIYPKIVVNAAGVYTDVIADMAGDRTFTIHPRKGTDIILDKKVGKFINSTMDKSPITVIEGTQKGIKAKVESVKFALSHENTSKGLAVIHTVDKNMIIGPNATETPDREDISTEKDIFDMIVREEMKVSEGIKPSDVIAYFTGVRSPSYEEDFQVRPGIFTENILEAAGVQSPGATAAPAIALDLAKWAVEYLEKNGVAVTRNTSFNPRRPKKPHLKDMTDEERAKLIAENPDYGQIVCRCEEISKGEILDALDSPLPVYTLDAIKRRCRPGMGRCQGGFCSPLVLQILAEAKGCSLEDIKKSTESSTILFGNTKNRGD